MEVVGEVEPIASCEEVIARNQPTVRPGEPAYLPAADVITMPGMDRFQSSEAYYAAFFHEMTHWTGHASRLNRPGITGPIRFGNFSEENLLFSDASATHGRN